MKTLIFSFFFLLINQGVRANDERVCRFDTTSNKEYDKIGWMVRDNISKAINLWLKEREILIENGPFRPFDAFFTITQRFSQIYWTFPEPHLRPIFSLKTDKAQILQSSWDLNHNFILSPEYRIEYSLVTIRDNQGIPLKTVCRITAKEDFILNIINATQGVKLDEINLYKEGDLIYQFEDEQESSSSVIEVEEMD